MSLKIISKIEKPYHALLFRASLGITTLGFVAYLCFRFQLIYLYHLDLGGLENNVIYGIQKILAGFPLYTNPESAPYDLIQKSPLYYYLMASLCQLFNVSSENPIELFRWSRILSLFLNLVSVSVYGLLAYRFFKIKPLAAFMISLAVMLTFTQHYYSRLDALYGFFFMLSLFFFFKYWQNFQKKYLIWTGIACVLLVFSKQTGAVLVAGMGLSLLWTPHKWNNIFTFASTGLLLTIFLVFLFDIDLYFYYQNAILGVRNGVSSGFLIGVLTSQYQLSLIVICVISCYFFYKIKNRNSSFNLLLSFALVYLIFGLFSCLKIAAGLNYLIEYKAFMFLILGALGFRYDAKIDNSAVFKILLYAAVFNIFISKFHHIYVQYQLGNYENNKEQYENEQAIAAYFKNELSLQSHEYIYFERNGFITHFLPTNMMLPVKSTTKEIYFNHPKTLDYSKLLEGMNQGFIKYLLVKEPNSITSIKCLGQVFDKRFFKKIKTINNYHIYKYYK